MYWHVAVVVNVEKSELGDEINVEKVGSVDENNVEKPITLHVIHMDRDGIREEDIDLSKPENQSMYRLDFGDDSKNPAWLVEARARAAVIKGTPCDFQTYGFLLNNCEMFANYCKLGVKKCRQLPFALRKIGEVIFGDGMICAARAVTLKLAKTLSISVLKSAGVTIAANVAGPALLVVLEGATCLYDATQFFKERKNGNLVWKRYNESVAKRIFESSGAAVGGAVMLGVGMLVSLIPGAGLVAVLVTGAVLGIAGTAVGRFAGNRLGRLVAMRIALHIKDDEVICDLDIVRGRSRRHHRTPCPSASSRHCVGSPNN